MKFLKALLYIVIGLVLVIGILSLVVPTKLVVTKTTVINAPKEVVWTEVSRLENLNKWSPWLEEDPNTKVVVEGTDGTEGAVSRWDSEKMGKGSQTITKLDEMNRVESHLNFIKPFTGEADASIELADTTGGTKVTWVFANESPRPWNVMNLFAGSVLKKQYTKGLSNLKTLSEQAPVTPKKYGSYTIDGKELPARVFVGKRATVDIPKVGDFYMENLPKVSTAVQKAGMETAGAPSGLYWTYDEKTMKTDMAAVVPVKEVKPAGKLETFTVDAGKGAEIDYYGSYEKIGDAHKAMDEYLKDHGIEKQKIVLEEYITGPMVEKDTSKWLTKIYYYF